MIKFLLLLTLALAQDTEAVIEPVIEPVYEKILVLTVDTIDQAIQKHPFLLIDFYAPWCAPCKQFEPDYATLNQKVQKENLGIRIAKYDATRDLHRVALEKFKIASFPSFLLFIEGRYFTFDGTRSADGILTWMKQLINGQNPTEIIFPEQLTDLIESSDAVLFYRGIDGGDPNFWTFYELSKTYPDVTYAYTTAANIGKPGGLYFYNKEMKQFTLAFTKQNIIRFILKQTLPEVPRVDETSLKLIYAGQPTFVLFSSLDEVSTKAQKAFLEVAQLFKNTYQFAYSNVADDSFFTELNKLGADDGIFPKIVLIETGAKYRYNGPDFSLKAIKQFIFDYRQNKVPKFLKSQPVPTKQDSYVKHVVGSTFQQEIADTNKDVLIEYYAEWCGACKQFKPHYDQVAYELRNNTNLIVAAVDHANNDIIHSHQPHSYPEIVFFKGGEKIKKPIVFESETRDAASVLAFVKKNLEVAEVAK